MKHIAILTLFFASTTFADPRREARALLREGNRLLEKSDYAGALELYRKAYETYPSARILVNIGTALTQLGRDAEAAEAYDRYLEDPTADSRERDEVQRILVEIETRLGVLRVHVGEPGARVLVNGRDVGEPPVRLRVTPGAHEVRAQKEGFAAPAATVTLGAGQEKVIELALAPATPAPAATPIRTTPEPAAPRPADAHPEASTAVVLAPREAGFRPPAWSPWVAFGLAAAAAGAGAYFGLGAMDKEAGLDSRETSASRATIAFVAAGAAAASGAGLWLWRYVTRDRAARAEVGLRADGSAFARVGF